jgi:hypothetical protein
MLIAFCLIASAMAACSQAPAGAAPGPAYDNGDKPGGGGGGDSM